MKFQILTNNPLVHDELKDKYALSFYECTYRDLLVRARDMIHMGFRLYSHPLSGSIKPNETPYRSLLLSQNPGDLDLHSLELIENGIAVFDKFPPRYTYIPERIRADFSLVDYSLLQNTLALL